MRQQRKQYKRELALRSRGGPPAAEMATSDRIAALSDVAWRRKAGQRPDPEQTIIERSGFQCCRLLDALVRRVGRDADQGRADYADLLKNLLDRVSEPVDIEIATLEAACERCGAAFDYPSRGDFAYGEFIFCSQDGRVYAYGCAFEPVAKLIEVLLPEGCSAGMYQAALAELADPMFGRKFTTDLRCPRCCSTAVRRVGRKTGTMWVKPTTYKNLLALRRGELIELVSTFAKNFQDSD